MGGRTHDYTANKHAGLPVRMSVRATYLFSSPGTPSRPGMHFNKTDIRAIYPPITAPKNPPNLPTIPYSRSTLHPSARLRAAASFHFSVLEAQSPSQPPSVSPSSPSPITLDLTLFPRQPGRVRSARSHPAAVAHQERRRPRDAPRRERFSRAAAGPAGRGAPPPPPLFLRR